MKFALSVMLIVAALLAACPESTEAASTDLGPGDVATEADATADTTDVAVGDEGMEDASADVDADTHEVGSADADADADASPEDVDVAADADGTSIQDAVIADTVVDAAPVDPATGLLGAWQMVAMVDNGTYEAIPAGQGPVHVFRSDGTLLFGSCGSTEPLAWALTANDTVIEVTLTGGTVLSWTILLLTATEFRFSEAGDEFHFVKITCS